MFWISAHDLFSTCRILFICSYIFLGHFDSFFCTFTNLLEQISGPLSSKNFEIYVQLSPSFTFSINNSSSSSVHTLTVDLFYRWLSSLKNSSSIFGNEEAPSSESGLRKGLKGYIYGSGGEGGAWIHRQGHSSKDLSNWVRCNTFSLFIMNTEKNKWC